MGQTKDTARLRTLVSSHCLILIKEAMDAAFKQFGSRDLPIASGTVLVLEPSSQGNCTGQKRRLQEPDTPLILRSIENALQSSAAWNTARNVLQDYIDTTGVKAGGFFLHDTDDHYLWPMLVSYLRDQNSFTYNPSYGRKAVGRLLKYLDLTDIPVFALIPLEGFSASRAFRLEQSIHIHPITESEIRELGRTDYVAPPGRYRFPNPLCENFPFPHSDWWICEINLPNPRGSAEGFNMIHRLMELLTLALRTFKQGKFSVCVALSGPSGFYGRVGVSFNKTMQRYSHGGKPYALSESELREFIRFWKGFRRIMDKEGHYLQIPARRLRSASTRREREDALVDYVIGLEALLGVEEERTELSYRFRIRGSVLLSKTRSARKGFINPLRELYDLRSRLVHGGKITDTKLEAMLPFAEDALRKVWRWFFRYWHDQNDNKKGVAQIDEDLVGR